MSDNALVNTILLQQAFGAGSHNGFKVFDEINKSGRLTLSWNELTGLDFLTDAQRKRMSGVSESIARKIMEDCDKNGIRILPYYGKDYPQRLRNILVPALVLYIKGEFPDVDNEPLFCIVGPRKVTPFGKKAAYSLSSRLARAGMTVVSGGALGADTYAHLGALKSGGKTVAFLGCGIAAKYLEKNAPLRREITKNGCLVSEYTPYMSANKFTFPVRNRLMSGISVGVAVIEAGIKSGALITARCANEQGKDVFVIPGNPADDAYKGSNELLRDGAVPLLNATDIFSAYMPMFKDKIDIVKAFAEQEKPKKEKIEKKLDETLSKEAKIVYNYIDKQKFTADDLLGTRLSPQDILSALTELEMEHLIKALPGGMYEREK